jgi:predicted alpha/beta hydrolase family esterase
MSFCNYGWMPNANQRVITKVLFIQGGGEGAHACDAALAKSLADELGPGYAVTYPKMPDEADPNYLAWQACIAAELNALGSHVVAVGHSIGASILIKFLAEAAPDSSVSGIFLIAPPFLHEKDGWPWKEAELRADAAETLPRGIPLFLYHGREDEVVPLAHLEQYSKMFRRALARELIGRNHQLNDDLTEVANDIRSVRG